MIKTFEQMCKTAADYDQIAKGMSAGYLSGIAGLGTAGYGAYSTANQMRNAGPLAEGVAMDILKKNKGKFITAGALLATGFLSSLYGAAGAFRSNPNAR